MASSPASRRLLRPRACAALKADSAQAWARTLETSRSNRSGETGLAGVLTLSFLEFFEGMKLKLLEQHYWNSIIDPRSTPGLHQA
jgi:hypothetical protein